MKTELESVLREKTMPPSREVDMKETAITSPPKEFKAADSATEYEMKCFACGAPTEWPHDICEACKKLSKMDCT